MKRVVSLFLCAGLAGCGAEAQVAPASTTPLPPAVPDLELRDARGAVVGGKDVAVDGVAEGLAWPALRAAIAARPGAPVTIAIARGVPLTTVMKAVWTLRDADLRLQTPDAAGVPHVVPLHPKPEPAVPAPEGTCHLAVFVAPNGDLRVAAPGGPHTVAGPDAPAALARALTAERARCTIRYVAFGADANDAPWSAVFDVAEAVDRDKSAGDARYVLGEPVHLAAR